MAAKGAKNEGAQEIQSKEAQTLNAIKRVAATEDGRLFIRYLMQQCGFANPSINVNPTTGQVLVDNTIYNEARRNVYLGLRALIPNRHLVKIEFNLGDDTDEIDWL